MTRFLRYLWAAPTTAIGLALALASLRRGHVVIVDGVIEAHGPFLRRALASWTPLARGADAMTLGHVVIGRDARALELTRAHERVHVRQYELWGPFFVPAYLLAGAWALLKGGHPYFDNRFEREARQAEFGLSRMSSEQKGLPATVGPCPYIQRGITSLGGESAKDCPEPALTTANSQ